MKPVVLLTVLLCSLTAIIEAAPPSPAQSPPFHQAYVWQRAWTPQVCEAVTEHGSNFEAIAVLSAEVSWKSHQPELVRVLPDYSALARAHCQIGLVLRIGPYSGSFATNDAPARYLGNLADSLLADAQAHGVRPCELQIDFDCASSRLDSYRLWLQAIRPRVSPVPIVPTVLPDWLNQPAFRRLLDASDGFVLQVHSLQPPKGTDAPFSLCDPAASRRWVAEASRWGKPFRVALPTYGYFVAFDPHGRFIGLSAEGPGKNWPADTQVREVRTDPLSLAPLVHGWTLHPPSELRGFIWYRLPVSGDALNWRWPTLAAFIAGHTPRANLQTTIRRVEPGLVEVSLQNSGELFPSSRQTVEATWQNARLIAADGLGGFELVNRGTGGALFRPGPRAQMPAPGESVTLGWLRFSTNCQVRALLAQEQPK